MRSILLALGLAVGLVLPGWSHEYRLGDLTVGHPYAVATPAGARTGAGYFSVTNAGGAPDRLLAVEAGFPRVELHTTTVDAAGVARMERVEALDLPPGATVALAPQATHVMLMGLTAPLEAGTKLPAVLVFERAGRLPVELNVEPRAAGDDGTMHMSH